jgi:hypothetical protein
MWNGSPEYFPFFQSLAQKLSNSNHNIFHEYVFKITNMLLFQTHKKKFFENKKFVVIWIKML